MQFEFDPHKARQNQRKHGVSFAHAAQALHDEMAVTIEDPDAVGEQRFITLGSDALGRLLVVIHTLRGERVASSPRARPAQRNRSNTMRDEYDFSKGKRGAVIASPGKTRITIMLDDDIIEEFKSRAERAGTGYQTLINSALRQAIGSAGEKPLTVEALRQVLREELHSS